ncbi:FAD/NAD(P)-binding domain-containing protein [Myriangium duriaei CBS 260.36]|uniref:FAD/NAD(P)-binding domain-containing protein n=1 Tax=Myriangium duriaei CBS 260.36 TaxID=1168546 RepID=A0A9P4J600_9PEZI|nr:FAD/NAD(P)-binding domain-containing protein [Myriangium duriaei CBS 260.36]
MPSANSNRSKKVAIIGSGCSGIAAAWALQSTDHEVHLFEKQDRLGGHTNTCQWKSPIDGQTTPVDTGFIVMNTATYPNFIRFLEHVGVPTAPTQMTFGVSRDSGKFEWSGNAEGIFAQRRNIFSPRHWRMIFDIVRFNQFALDLLREDDEIKASSKRPKEANGVDAALQAKAYKSIGAYLHEEGYSQAFKDDYLIPMTAAVWSTSPDKASLDFPAITLVRFMWNHHLLSTITTRPLWLTIPGGSKKYIDAVISNANPRKFKLHTGVAVTEVRRKSDGKRQVIFADPGTGPPRPDTFDHVIFATHGDEILPLITPSKSASPLEESILSNFKTTKNTAYLHSDLSLMPRRRQAWTAWNYLTTSTPSRLSHPAGVSLTYDMNLLQHLPENKFGNVLVTLNPPHPPEAHKTQGKYIYHHPLYTPQAVRAQSELSEIQNIEGLSYAGAWTKYGFHEDGFSSGLKVAIEHLGAELPFEFKDSTFSRGTRPHLGFADQVVRRIISIIHKLLLVLGIILSLGPVAWFIDVLYEAHDVLVERYEGKLAKR